MKKFIKPASLVFSGILIARYVDWSCISSDVATVFSWIF